jgi:hypothetical protein
VPTWFSGAECLTTEGLRWTDLDVPFVVRIPFCPTVVASSWAVPSGTIGFGTGFRGGG